MKQKTCVNCPALAEPRSLFCSRCDPYVETDLDKEINDKEDSEE